MDMGARNLDADAVNPSRWGCVAASRKVRITLSISGAATSGWLRALCV
jgi:hypothetical protein